MKDDDIFMKAETFFNVLDSIKKYPARDVAPDLGSYCRLLDPFDEVYTLLLLQGESLILNIEPINIHLLPPLQNVENERWLIAYYVDRSNTKSFVQLFKWSYSDRVASIVPMQSKSANLITGLTEISNNAVLPRESAKAINFQSFGASYVIQLQFVNGELTVTADQENGIASSSWQSLSSQAIKRKERFSLGAMETAIEIESPKDWHKNIEDEERGDKVYFDNKLAKPTSGLSFGRINGCDGSNKANNKIYIASNNGRVFSVDTDKLSTPARVSEQLTGPVHDVLVVDNDKLLTSVYNGSFYLLEDEGKKLKIIDWQYSGLQIRRLIGFGENYLLALDRSNNIYPLLLFKPSEFDNERKKITSLIYKNYIPEGSSHIPQWDDDNQDSINYIKLLLDHYIYNGGCNHPFLTYCDDMLLMYSIETPENIYSIAKCHKDLLTKLLRFLRKICFSPGDGEDEIETAIQALLRLIEIPKEVPDFLWLWLSRNYDWISFSKRNNRIKNYFSKPDKKQLSKEFKNKLTTIHQELNCYRKDIRLSLCSLTPIVFTDSYRLKSQAQIP